jgi:hypothetical protein
MSDIIKDSEIRCLAKMQVTYDIMKTCFPSDKEIMSAWCRLTKETQELIEQQEQGLKRFEKD